MEKLMVLSCFPARPKVVSAQFSIKAWQIDGAVFQDVQLLKGWCSRADAWQNSSFLCQEVWGQKKMVAVT